MIWLAPSPPNTNGHGLLVIVSGSSAASETAPLRSLTIIPYFWAARATVFVAAGMASDAMSSDGSSWNRVPSGMPAPMVLPSVREAGETIVPAVTLHPAGPGPSAFTES
jgi:hypothetical protein